MSLKDLIMKKLQNGDVLDEKSKEAKLAGLETYSDGIKSDIGSKLREALGKKDAMAQATVTADSPEGLKEGLDQASDVVESMPEDKMHEMGESSIHEASEAPEIDDNLQEDDLIALKKAIEDKLAKLAASK